MEITEWKQKEDLLSKAKYHLHELEKLLHWSKYESMMLKNLSSQLESTLQFFNYIQNTRYPIANADHGYFSVLPSEVLLCILSHLDLKSLLRMSAVCKEFRTLTEDESLWQGIAKAENLMLEFKPEVRTWKWFCFAYLRKFKEGEFKEGPGTATYPCPSGEEGKHIMDTKYAGDWHNNTRHGHGTYFWCNGSYYTGEWKDDQREGRGMRIWPNKNKYTGEYHNHKRHGQGDFTFSNGSVFVGTFEDNRFVKGTYTWPNGRVYDGEWNNIFRHGFGSYWWPDGRHYVGEWKDDKRHGHGIYTWPDGDSYEGEFRDGKRVGRGVLRCANGDVYDQEWAEEKFEEDNKGIEESTTDTETSPRYVTKKRKVVSSLSEEKSKRAKQDK